MSRIGIITHYGVHNHGAQLQLYALMTTFRDKGHECHALQFEKNYCYMEKNALNKYKISIKSIPFYITYFWKQGLKKTLFNIRKKTIFDKFRVSYNILGEKYDEFYGDLAVVGSDEVFSFETGVTDTFWGINTKAKKLVSYAASFGPSTIQEIKDKKLDIYVSDALNHFDSLSVRDKNSQEIIKYFSGKDVDKHCDPVLLYGYKNEISEYAHKVKSNKPYILLYSYDNNMNDEQDIEMIRHISESTNLPIYSVGFYHKWCDKNINANPLELLGWFKNASFVITDTFHGTVLSIITHSSFATKIRGNSNKLYNLLSEYNLQNRIYTDIDSCKTILNLPIDYESVENSITSYRNDANKYLSGILNLS
ncbi:MAG: polysaccharide pyruvyl transferase family protein [Bacteroidales bacterium]|nr:polysaccharide pyruvyl transferase family protein [Bacteroidales bacterium]